LLPTCFEGLLESKHPYNFIAKQVIKDMLEEEGAPEKTIPIVGKLVWPLRQALSNKDEKVFESAVEVMGWLSEVVQDYMNPHLKILVVPLMKS
jgi:UDP-N-acetylglucosamine 2-epimerase